jgi:DNA-binding transcriptional LysR family regulator
VDSEGLSAQRLLTEPLVVVLAREHPLAARRRLRITDLRHERFIAFREGAGLRRILASAAHDAGFDAQVAFETNEVERAQAMAARGLGVTVIPESDVHHHGPPVAVVPLHRPTLTRDVTLVWREGRRLTPAARAFLELARTADRTGAPTVGQTPPADAGVR